MSDIVWKSINDKLEAIGYLAIPGVIGAIEATVPKGKTDKFKKEYAYKYSEEYPYEANKYGYQFRIYLNDTDGCPDCLKEHLDSTYGNRINNTDFISELVKEYGFMFKKGNQDSEVIRTIVSKKHSVKEYLSFDKGFKTNVYFINRLDDTIQKQKVLPAPNPLKYKEKSIKRRETNRIVEERGSAYSKNQLLMLGWLGEQYIAYLLKTRNKKLLSELVLSSKDKFEINWFNQGFQDAKSVFEFDNSGKRLKTEECRKWEDQSIGKGCDIVLTLENGKEIYIEVKTSRKNNSFFNMTSLEIQEMEKRGEDYYIIKINNFENVINKKSPDIIVINNPFEKLFKPKHVKEATFVVGGE